MEIENRAVFFRQTGKFDHTHSHAMQIEPETIDLV